MKYTTGYSLVNNYSLGIFFHLCQKQALKFVSFVNLSEEYYWRENLYCNWDFLSNLFLFWHMEENSLPIILTLFLILNITRCLGVWKTFQKMRKIRSTWNILELYSGSKKCFKFSIIFLKRNCRKLLLLHYHPRWNYPSQKEAHFSLEFVLFKKSKCIFPLSFVFLLQISIPVLYSFQSNWKASMYGSDYKRR